MSKAPTLEEALAAAEVLRDYAQEESSVYNLTEGAMHRRIETQAILDLLRKRKAEKDAAAPKVTTLGDLIAEDFAEGERLWNAPAAVAARAAEIDAARAARAARKGKRK